MKRKYLWGSSWYLTQGALILVGAIVVLAHGQLVLGVVLLAFAAFCVSTAYRRRPRRGTLDP